MEYIFIGIGLIIQENWDIGTKALETYHGFTTKWLYSSNNWQF